MQSQKKKSRKIKGSTKRATINFGLDGKISYVKNTNKVLGFSRAEILWKKFSAFLVTPYDSLFQPSLLNKYFQTEAQFEQGAQTNTHAFTSTIQWPMTSIDENMPFNPLSDDDLTYLQMHMPFGPDVPNDLLISNVQNSEYADPSILLTSNSHKRKHDHAHDDHVVQPVLKRAILECVGRKGEHIPLNVSFLKTTKGGALRESEFSCSLERLENETLITIKDNGIIIYCDENFPSIFGEECSKAVGTNLCTLIPSYSKHSLQIQIKKSTQFNTNFIGYTFDHQRMFLRVEGAQTTAREFTLWSLKISKVDSLMDALLGIDETGAIISTSGFCELLLGYHPSLLSGKNIQELIQTVPTSVVPPCNQTAIPESVSGSQIISITGSATGAVTGYINKPFSLTEASRSDDIAISDPNSPQGSTTSTPKIAVSEPLLNLNTDAFILLPDGWWVPVTTRLIPATENTSTAYYVQVNRTSMDEFWEHPSEAIGNYYFVSQLGKGSSSNVWLGMRKTDFKLCAVKTLKPAKDTNHVHDEATILKSLHHPQFIEVMQVNDATHIVMEHIDGVDLMSLVSQSKGLPESLARAIFMQVLSALHYCHFEAKIVHRDLKPQNIIVDKLGRVKLIDFGFAHKIEDGAKFHCLCGTPAYAPPCLLAGKCFYGPEIDMWALGILLYTMVTAKLPFRDVQQVLEGTFEEPAVTPECLDLMHCLLTRDVNKRATYEKVIEHPWLTRSQKRTN